MKLIRGQLTSLKTHFMKAMLLMLLPLVLIGASGFFAMIRISDSFNQVVDEATEEVHMISHLQIAVSRAGMPPNDYLINNDSMEQRNWIQFSREVDLRFEEALDIPYDLIEEKELIQSALREWQEARSIAQSLFDFKQPIGNPIAAREMKRMDAYMDRAVDLLASVHSLAEGKMKEDLKTAHAVRRRSHMFFACISGFGMVLAIKSGMVLFRSIRLPLKQLEEGARRFGKGDLGYRLPLAATDELGQVMQTFNVMAEMLEKNQTELKALAVRDGLTGLFNHREFYRRLEEEIERVRRYGHPCSLLMLDIDHFKKINDTHGHQAGDRVLRILANWIRSEVRPTDQVSRYGGEEFTIILPETPETEALKAAERIRKGISECEITLLNGEELNVTLSFGVATFPNDAKSAEELVAHADRALYAAKDAGRNRVCH
jgi:two-component system cell cycle response regulator